MSTYPRSTALLSMPLLVLLAGAGLRAQKSVFALTDTEKEAFLRSADVVKTKELGVGITNSLRLTLNDGERIHDAHFQSINVRKAVERTTSGLEANFADSYNFNIAAYKLDRMLGLKMIPVSVERTIGGKRGALTWWVDAVLMMEKDRYVKKIEPPDLAEWNEQIHRVRVFNELVYNTDPNLGNLLITTGWKLRMIDFTRAFRPFGELRKKQNLSRIDRNFYEALKRLEETAVRREFGDFLLEREIGSLMERRTLLVEFFDRAAARKGPGKVFYD